MKIRQDKNTCQFGSALICQHLQSLLQEVDGVLRGDDIEYIHRMRVATRRLRATIPLFLKCFPGKKVTRWQKNIRKLTRALSAARDRDVQLLSLQNYLAELTDPNLITGVNRLVLRLSQNREFLQYDVIRKLTAFQASGVIPEIEKTLQLSGDVPSIEPPYSHLLYRNSALAIHEAYKQLKSHQEYIFDPSNVEELHQMRISAKNLRYVMEAFSPIYGNGLKDYIQPVKKFQDLLGDIHDCDVWLTFIPDFIEKERDIIINYCGSPEPLRNYLPGIISFRENRLFERRELYAIFIEDWSKVYDSGIWEGLLATIDRPLQKFGTLFPLKRDYNFQASSSLLKEEQDELGTNEQQTDRGD